MAMSARKRLVIKELLEDLARAEVCGGNLSRAQAVRS
jgi:hypothetical protein